MNIGQIYEDYFLDVYKYVRGLSASDTVAEEITQETFFRAMRSLDSFRGDKEAFLETVKAFGAYPGNDLSDAELLALLAAERG